MRCGFSPGMLAQLVTSAALVALVLQVLPQKARTRGAVEQNQRNIVVRGQARVIDGDTLDVAGERVRLEGIDAPEIKQSCPKADRPNGTWPAGRIAALALERWVRDREVACRQIGRDGFGRMIGRCHADGRDLNAAMVRHGLAWAFLKYSQTFAADERAARSAALGVWSSSCKPAWEYRANRWREVAPQAPAGCPIKGNISRNGRIYHMPWSPWYRRTRIEPRKGERWFCDEGQALAAGWRPAQTR